jgi:hypothetical protein
MIMIISKSTTRFAVLRLFAEQTDHFWLVISVANGLLDIPEGLAVLDDAPSVLLPSSKWLSDKNNQCVMAGHANDAFVGWTADSASHIGKWVQAYEICVGKFPVVKRGGAAKRGRSGSWWVGGGEEPPIKRSRSMCAALSNDTQLQVGDGAGLIARCRKDVRQQLHKCESGRIARIADKVHGATKKGLWQELRAINGRTSRYVGQ